MRVTPPDDEREPVSRLGAHSRDELVAIVRRVMAAEGTERELDELVATFEQSVPHPGATDLIYWDGRELTAEQIVDEALNYKAIEL